MFLFPRALGKGKGGPQMGEGGKGEGGNPLKEWEEEGVSSTERGAESCLVRVGWGAAH